MSLDRYYTRFFLQAWTPGPDGFGGIKWSLSDGMLIMAAISKATQAEIRVAEAQGLNAQYNMATDIRLNLEQNDVLRRESDDTFFRITGIPEKSPEPAVSKFQVFPVELIERASIGR